MFLLFKLCQVCSERRVSPV